MTKENLVKTGFKFVIKYLGQKQLIFGEKFSQNCRLLLLIFFCYRRQQSEKLQRTPFQPATTSASSNIFRSTKCKQFEHVRNAAATVHDDRTAGSNSRRRQYARLDWQQILPTEPYWSYERYESMRLSINGPKSRTV